jgi:hypothetical protein
MILSNSTTQEILVINKITNGIVYTLYENAYYRDNSLNGVSGSIVWSLDKDLMPDASLSFKDNELKLAYHYLETLPEFSNFTFVEDDDQAWTMNGKVLRIFINNDQIMQSMEDKDDLNTIIERLRDENSTADPKFIYRGKTQTVLYLNSVRAEDADIVSNFTDTSLFIENKA